MISTSHPVPLARAARLLATGAMVVLAAAGTAPTAFAAPGDNGDIKVHESTTPTDDQRDEPKVCTFYLDAFNFDTVQKVTWNIEHQPADGGQAAAGEITLASGTGRTADMTLPNGMYKVNWTFEGEQGSGKHKVFRVDCPPNSSPSASPSGGAGGNPSGGPNGGTPGGGAAGGGPHGGLNTGGGGTSQGLNPLEVGAGSALLVLAAGLGVRAVRRRATRNAAS
ncbi:hypothetical protein KCMC57_up61300 [Kitasatospora sp. CMC57]|uniref:Gram-positive cocci surface proteins LPxTG domain-containing protein n=1 Tax=Kitasatospora sp. CMC57 TaxID=3231513 RepID=A0AB33KB82_9ACTN